MKFRSLILITLSIFTVALKAQTLQDGLLALDCERYEGARNIFTQLCTAEPTKGNHCYYLGQAYWFLYKPDSAKMSYEKGIAADPQNPANYAGLGQLLLEENKIPEAKAQFEKALSISRGRDGKTKDINALIFVANAMVSAENKLVDDAVVLVEQGLETNKKNYDLFITAGDVYLEKNDGGKAATNYENAISLDKANPKAYVRVAGIWLRVKNAEATNNELKRAIEINPNYAPALKAYAEYYYQTRQFAKAKESYIKYLENSEPSVANKARFARILFRSKEYEEALTQLLDILKVDQSDIFMYRMAGYSYYEVGNEKKDTSYFRPGVKMMETFMQKVDPSKILSNDYEYLGKLYSRIPGEDSLAIYNISKAIETDPSKIDLYKEAGMIYNRLKKFDKAVFYFEGYIAKAPKLTPADYYLLGVAAYFGKQYSKADSAFIKVNEMKPDYAEGYLWRGNANANLDPDAKTTVAKDNYEKFISLTEAMPDKYKKNLIISYDYIARYYIKKDDTPKAKDYLNKVLALDPNNTTAKEYLKQLK